MEYNCLVEWRLDLLALYHTEQEIYLPQNPKMYEYLAPIFSREVKGWHTENKIKVGGIIHIACQVGFKKHSFPVYYTNHSICDFLEANSYCLFRIILIKRHKLN